MNGLAPAVVVAVFDDTGARASRPVLEQLARVAAPGDLAVCLHTKPDDSDHAAVELVRSLGLRLWWGLPADGVARIWRQQGDDAAIAMLRTWLARLPPWAPEVICIDGEGAWKPLAGDPPSGLGELAKASIAAVRETVPGAAVSWPRSRAPSPVRACRAGRRRTRSTSPAPRAVRGRWRHSRWCRRPDRGAAPGCRVPPAAAG